MLTFAGAVLDVTDDGMYGDGPIVTIACTKLCSYPAT
jgi:hypothetical protein